MSRNKNGIRVRYRNRTNSTDRMGDVTPNTTPGAIADWILVNAEAGDFIVLSDGSRFQKLPSADA